MYKKIAILLSFVLLAGCTTDPYTGERKLSKTAIGIGAGALGGAAIGAMTSSKKNRKKNALLGAGIGAIAGGGVGAYMDQQDKELRQELQATGVSVTRSGDDIILNMPGHITFKTNSADISSDFYPVLRSVSKVLNKYKKTFVEVTGHTDSTGSADYNQRLSYQRAQSVSQYLMSQSVNAERFFINGAGESQPTASNNTDAGRQANRRVEITLSAITE